jgi:hypothetical protein
MNYRLHLAGNSCLSPVSPASVRLAQGSRLPFIAYNFSDRRLENILAGMPVAGSELTRLERIQYA